jgi:uncharacterized protein (TIGR02147 family)
VDNVKKNHIFTVNRTFSTILTALFHEVKLERVMSLEYLARKLGYKSKGHLSGILKGERRLPLAKCPILKEIFRLSDIEYDILYLACSTEHAFSPTEKESIRIRQSIVRDQYTQRHLSTLPEAIDVESLATVYCSVGLIHKEHFSIEDITHQVALSGEIVRECVNFLNENEVIKKVDDSNLYVLTGNHLRASGDDLNFKLSVNSFFINLALDNMEECYSFGKDESCFASTLVSVKKDDFKDFIKRYKRFIQSEVAKLESVDGDSLVVINSQVFPYTR